MTTQGDHYTHYLEMLDDEYWALKGKLPPQSTIRDEFALLYRIFHELPDDTPEQEQRKAEAKADLAKPEAEFRRDVLKRLAQEKRSALCFSGGGIRSATFGLGILQALAAFSRPGKTGPALLGEFDYLSTVSGGGYLGGWFSAWAAREGTAKVIDQLSKTPDIGFDPEPDPVRHLRAYSNYLSPRLGLFSGDTWAAAGSVLRNMLLNWLVLLPMFAAVLLIPIFALNGVASLDGTPDVYRWVLLAGGLFFGTLATAYIGFDLPSLGNARSTPLGHAALCLGPLALAAISFTTFWAWLGPGDPAAPWWNLVALGHKGIHWWHFSLLGAIMHASGMLIGTSLAMTMFQRPAPKILGYATGAAILTGLIASPVAAAFTADGVTDSRLYTCLAFPTVLCVFLIGGTLLVGLTSYITDDKDREWWARSGGIVLAMALAWPVFAAITLYSQVVLAWLSMKAAASLTALTGWGAAKLGSSEQTPATSAEASPDLSKLGAIPWAKQIGARMILPVFLVLMAMLLSLLSWNLIDAWQQHIGPGFALPGLFIGYALLCIIASFFINVNSFSMHAMYRQRLIRAYLGASNTDRKPHWFTGFDEKDNMPMCKLPAKPLHVVNMTLNLVSGKNLAWQQRKAESFTASRLHTGSCRLVYRSSSEYGGSPKLKRERAMPVTLGTAMTISGAAASPNMGYNSSPLLALVMTLFNARLGWWAGNPADKSDVWRKPGPNWGVLPFIYEAFGLTDDERAWIYLSDGGHFENLGLYEMVFRRCRTIIVSDGGADADYKYEDLGNAVRKIRIDLGIPIEFKQLPTMSPKTANPADRRHCAIATIRYSAVDGTAEADDGVLVYIKASVDGDEPADVLHYASMDPRFPHQPTPDQYFDEAQFESYRRLGVHIIEKICGASGVCDLQEFVNRAKTYAQLERTQAAAAGQSSAGQVVQV